MNNKFLKYNYIDHKTLEIEILVNEVNITNFIDIIEKIESLKLSRISTVNINMKNVNYIDSSGFTVFLNLRKILIEKNIDLFLNNCCHTIIDKFDLLEISDLFNINKEIK